MKIDNNITSMRMLTKNFGIVKDDVAVERYGGFIEKSIEKGML